MATTLPACKFSRSVSTTSASTSSTFETVTTIGDEETTSTSIDESSTSSTEVGATSTSRLTTTTKKPTPTTARPTTTRPSGPHCAASVDYPTAAVGYNETITVTSNLPNRSVTATVDTAGTQYSGNTDGAGSWAKNQHVNQAMAHKTTHIYVTIAGGASCSTSFTVS